VLVSALAWMSLASLSLIVFSEVFLGLAIFVSLAAIGHQSRAGASKQSIRWALAAGAMGIALHVWGMGLAHFRDTLHEPTWGELEVVAMLLIVTTGGLAWWRPAERLIWWLAGSIGLLAHATVYRYGAMPALVNVWLAWVVATCVGMVASRRRGEVTRLKTAAPPLALALGIGLLIQPFSFAEAGNFQMHTWRAWVPALMPHGHEQWVTATLGIKLLIFARWRVPHWLKPLGVTAAVVVQAVHWGSWHPTPTEYGVMIASLTIVGGVAPRWLSEEAARELRRVCWLWALYAAYYYSIRIPNDHYMWADCFLAGLSLSARLAARNTCERARRHHYAILTMFGVVVAGWVTLAWTLHLYEWKFLYEIVSPGFAEDHALWFVPIINGRYLIPIVMARIVLWEGFGYQTPYPKRLIWTAAGAKVASLAIILTGIGYVMADSDVYLEAIGEAAALSVFVVGLL
jgi:hypothetical protein